MAAFLPSLQSFIRLAALRGAAIFLIVLATGGCSTSADDQRFFERGWLWPRNLDTPDRPVTSSEKFDAAAAAEADEKEESVGGR